MRVHVRYVENQGFVRYLLQRSDGCFWSGEAWKRSRRRAALFENLADCHREYFRLTDSGIKGPVRKFTARFDVFVSGNADFTEEELVRWLLSHVRFTVTTEEGPVERARTQVYARFGTLVEEPGGC